MQLLSFRLSEALYILQTETELKCIATLNDLEELILIGVLMPVVLSLHDAEPHYRVVDPTERVIDGKPEV